MGTSGNRDSKLAARSVLNDFTDDAWTIPAGISAQMMKATRSLQFFVPFPPGMIQLSTVKLILV